MDLIVRKSTQVKKMTQYAWDLLKNKNGWEIVTPGSEPVINQVAIEPETGDKKVDNSAIFNEIAIKPEDQLVINEEEVTFSTFVDNENNDVVVSNVEIFVEVAKTNLNKEKIKNYLDSKEVSYHQALGIDKLIGKLSEVLSGNTETLKSEFNL